MEHVFIVAGVEVPGHDCSVVTSGIHHVVLETVANGHDIIFMALTLLVELGHDVDGSYIVSVLGLLIKRSGVLPLVDLFVPTAAHEV